MCDDNPDVRFARGWCASHGSRFIGSKYVAYEDYGCCLCFMYTGIFMFLILVSEIISETSFFTVLVVLLNIKPLTTTSGREHYVRA